METQTEAPKTGREARGNALFVWIALAAVAAATMLFFDVLAWTGACYDAVEGGESYCTSGPMVGVAAAWVIGVVFGVVLVGSVVQAVRVARRPRGRG